MFLEYISFKFFLSFFNLLKAVVLVLQVDNQMVAKVFPFIFQAKVFS